MTTTVGVDPAETFDRSIRAGYVLDRLAQAKVLVVGVGGLGQNLLLDLALSGFGNLTIVDFDRIEPHNLPRMPLIADRAGSAGDRDQDSDGKATSVLDGLIEKMRAPLGEVRVFSRAVEELAPSVIEAADVVVSAVDSVPTRRYLARWCRLLGVPLVEGGFAGGILNIALYSDDRNDACYGCRTFTGPDTTSCTEIARLYRDAEVVPTLQTTASVAAGLMAEMVSEVVHHRAQKYGRQLHLNLREWRHADMHVERRESCTVGHEPIHEAIDLDVVPSDWHALEALVGSPITNLVLPSPLVRCALCPTCHRWVLPNEPDWLFFSRSTCRRGESADLTPGGFGITQIRREIDRRDLDEVSDMTDPAWLGLRPGGRPIVRTSKQNVLVRLPGVDAPDHRRELANEN